jgi:hypothetical protein
MLFFSKLFTRRRLQREQEARQDPYLSVPREAACTLPAENVRLERNDKYQQYHLKDIYTNCHSTLMNEITVKIIHSYFRVEPFF